MTELSDICTLVWPELRERGGALPPSAGSGAWIIGWNPVGLSVIATALLSNMTFEEARLKLAEVKQALEPFDTPPGVPRYKSLQLLGYVRGAAVSTASVSEAGAANFPAASPTTRVAPAAIRELIGGAGSPTGDADVRAMRKSDIWLELQEGPVLGEVWCCGYRVQPCQLHVIRCDPLRHYSVKPTVFSAVSLYGPGGVQQLRQGKRPIPVAGAESCLEGVLLPDVMKKESAPRPSNGLPGMGESLQHQLTGGANPYAGPHISGSFLPSSSITGRRRSHHRRHQQGTGSTPGSASKLTRTAEGSGVYDGHHTGLELSDSGSEITSFSFIHGGPALGSFSDPNQYGDSFSQHPGYDDNTSGGSRNLAARARPGVPPRLDFPLSTDTAEMNTMLRLSQYGYNVQCVLQGLAPREGVELGGPLGGSTPSTSPRRSVVAVHGAGGHDGSPSPTVHTILSVLIWCCLTCMKVLTPLRRVSWLAEVIDHRVRELANLLSLLDNRTQSCGLHPALPHRVHTCKSDRTVCLLNYLLRVFTDVLFGTVVMLLLRTQGPRMYTMAMHLSRYFLYSLHMSYMDWFDGWPAGLKVNEDLNQALCFTAKVILKFWDLSMRGLFLVNRHINTQAGAILSKDGDSAESLAAHRDSDAFGSTEYLWIVPSYDILKPLSLLGASCSCALVVDITGIVTLHLRFLYHAMSLPYRFACAVTSSLSNQFRGKKYNPLRKRTDVYEFTVDQMLMGTFIFTIVVFLFPTVAVYYFYFALVRTSVWVVQQSLAAVAHAMLYLPFLPVAVFSLFGQRLTDHLSGGVELSDPIVTMQRAHPSGNGANGHYSAASTTVEMTVQSKPFSTACFFSDFLYVIMVVAKPLLPTHALSLIFSGRPAASASPRQDLIPHLVANSVDPPCTLCVPPGTSATLLSSATTAATMSVNAAAPVVSPPSG